MKQFKIEENDANQRLDKFLKKLFPRATRWLLFKFNRKDKIKVKFDGSEWKYKKRDNEYKLALGDTIKIMLSDKDFDLLKPDNFHELITPFSSMLPQVNAMFEY